MYIREATIQDIKQIQHVRNAVKENVLSDPALVSDEDCKEYISERGKGWVCEVNNQIAGFAIADLKEDNIWALFVDPEYEKQGIGFKLHNAMLDWYFSCRKTKVWLSTAPGTRAEIFYRKAGWKHTGMHGKNELKFEITNEEWNNQRLELKVIDPDNIPDIILTEEVNQLIEMYRGFYPKIGFVLPWVGYFILKDKMVLGSCGFVGKPENNTVEIAYWTFKEHEGNGIASFACRKLINIAQSAEKEIIITAKTAPEKNVSTRILEKNNFIYKRVVQDKEIGDAWLWELQKK